ncbi:MAG: YcxB family protein [Cyanobacteria bacterium P01_A01_bin.40]
MDETIYLKYPWKTEDIVKGYKYHRKSANVYRILTIVYLIIGIVNICLGLYGIFVRQDSGSWSSVVLGIFFLFVNRINLFFYARNFQKLNYENKQVEWEISKDKIIHRMINLSESTFNWDLIQGISDTQEGFLLYPQKNMFYWLPKSAFNSEEDIAYFVFIAQDKVKNWQQIK